MEFRKRPFLGFHGSSCPQNLACGRPRLWSIPAWQVGIIPDVHSLTCPLSFRLYHKLPKSFLVDLLDFLLVCQNHERDVDDEVAAFAAIESRDTWTCLLNKEFEAFHCLFIKYRKPVSIQSPKGLKVPPSSNERWSLPYAIAEESHPRAAEEDQFSKSTVSCPLGWVFELPVGD